MYVNEALSYRNFYGSEDPKVYVLKEDFKMLFKKSEGFGQQDLGIGPDIQTQKMEMARIMNEDIDKYHKA